MCQISGIPLACVFEGHKISGGDLHLGIIKTLENRTRDTNNRCDISDTCRTLKGPYH